MDPCALRYTKESTEKDEAETKQNRSVGDQSTAVLPGSRSERGRQRQSFYRAPEGIQRNRSRFENRARGQ